MYKSDIAHINKSLERKLTSLYSLKSGAKITQGFTAPYTRLLESLGNPHLTLPPTIHVAGTNGKGSTIAFMRAILEQAGHKVHAYTSPHLIRFNERIVIAGKQMNDRDLEALIDEVLDHDQAQGCSFFEVTTAMAFLAFSRQSADILLLETGLGGRLDCTNIIQYPEVCVFTKIGLDHMEILGNTYEKIVYEKVGILKKTASIVIGFQGNQASKKNVESAAHKQKLSKQNVLYRFDNEWNVTASSGRMVFSFLGREEIFNTPALRGDHQVYNAGAAMCALKALAARNIGFKFCKGDFEKGLRSVSWRGRMQKLDTIDVACAYGVSLGDAIKVYLDGGHNADAGEALASVFKAWADEGAVTHLIIGMMGHKDCKSFVSPISQYVQSISCVPIDDEPQAASPYDLYDVITHENKNIAKNIQDALSIIAKNIPVSAFDKGFQHNIVICGSLYLAGNVLKTLEVAGAHRDNKL